MFWHLPVARWSIWAPGLVLSAGAGNVGSIQDSSTIPEVKFVPSLLRRRLGCLARMALSVAEDCAGNIPALRVVYASRHGDLLRSVDMQTALAQNELLSPTSFSLSVHNAIAGIYSILHQDNSPSTAIAAGEETLGFALLEAASQFSSDPGVPVLLIYADEPAPDVFSPYLPDYEQPCAMALLLSNDAKQIMHCRASAADTSASEEPQAFAFLKSLSSCGDAQWSNGRRTWNWSCVNH